MKTHALLSLVFVAACAPAAEEVAPADPSVDDTAKEDFFLKVRSPDEFRKAMNDLYKIVPAGTSHGFTRGEGEPCTVIVEHWDSRTSGPGIRVTTWRDNDAPGWDTVGDPSFTFEIRGQKEPIRVSLDRVDTISATVKRVSGFETTRQRLNARGSIWADVPFVQVWSSTGVFAVVGDSLTCASLSPEIRR